MLSLHAIEVLVCLATGGRNFSKIVFRLDLNPKVVSESLKELERLELARKLGDKYYVSGKGLEAAKIICDLERSI